MNAELHGEVEISHRIQVEWAQFHTQQLWLLNSHESLKLRLQLFDVLIGAAAMCGCNVVSCTNLQQSRQGAAQRKLLRSPMDRMRYAHDPWRDTMHHMKMKIAHALNLFYAESLESSIRKQHWGYIARASHNEKSQCYCIVVACRVGICPDISSEYNTIRIVGRFRNRFDSMINSFGRT